MLHVQELLAELMRDELAQHDDAVRCLVSTGAVVDLCYVFAGEVLVLVIAIKHNVFLGSPKAACGEP